MKQNLSVLVRCSLSFSLLWGTAGKHSGLRYIPLGMDDFFPAVSKNIEQRVLTNEYETAIRIHRQLLVFFGENAVDISTLRGLVSESRECGGNL